MRIHIAERNLLAAGGLILAAVFSGLKPAEAQEEKAIDNRLQQYETRFNQGDAEAVARLFSENVFYYDPTGQVHEGTSPSGSEHRP